jgi:DNA-binding response OmpR family regulator
VLFISGYTDDDATRKGLLAAGQSFLPKPFTPSELVGRVREVLESGQAPPT